MLEVDLALERAIERCLLANSGSLPFSDLINKFGSENVLAPCLTSIQAFWSDKGLALEWDRESVRFSAMTDHIQPIESRERGKRALTQAALATLMVVALHQPISKPGIEKVRGVRLQQNILDDLTEQHLIEVIARRKSSGQALLYVTTRHFLDIVGIDQLSNLPTSEEIFMMDFG